MAQITCNFVSYSLRHPVDIEIILPSMSSTEFDVPNYSHIPPAKYPVLYLLHGYGNDYRSWFRFTSVERYAEERRIAVVTCSVNNSGYQNLPRHENYYDFLAKELPEFICGNFPISDRPEDTYIAGLSMGGFGTLLHSVRDGQMYAAAGAFSPGIKMDALGVPDLTQEFRDAAADGRKLPKLFMCIGDKDFLYESVTEFHNELVGLGIEHEYHDVPGFKHEFALWDDEMRKFLDWLPRTDYYASLPIRWN